MDADERAAHVGRFASDGSPGIEIVAAGEGLAFHLPGAPAWTDTPLRAAPAGADHQLEFAAGGFEGAPLRCERGDAGLVEAITMAGVVRFGRVRGDGPQYVCREREPLSSETLRAFEAFRGRALLPAAGAVVDYDLPQPLHIFLQWLCDAHGALLHGSNRGDIARFDPQRKTIGPSRDQSDRGISACSDSLWAMAYAVLDRGRYQGAFHNLAMPFERAEGGIRLYHFSIGATFRDAQPPPFTSGTVYVLDGDGFKPVRGASFSPVALEYSKRVPAAPLARFRVTPEDFVLLDQVRGHDDRRALRFIELRSALLKECARAEPLQDGYRFHFDRRRGLHADLLEFCEMLARGFPWVDSTLHIPPRRAQVTLTLAGSTGLRDFFDASLAQLRVKD